MTLLTAVDRHDDVDLGADEDEEVVRDVALPVEVLPRAHLASSAQLGDERDVGGVQGRKCLWLDCHGAVPPYLGRCSGYR